MATAPRTASTLMISRPGKYRNICSRVSTGSLVKWDTGAIMRRGRQAEWAIDRLGEGQGSILPTSLPRLTPYWHPYFSRWIACTRCWRQLCVPLPSWRHPTRNHHRSSLFKFFLSKLRGRPKSGMMSLRASSRNGPIPELR